MDPQRQNVVVIVLLIVLLVVLVLLFIFRRRLIGISPNMTRDQALAAGYGYYEEPVIGDCITPVTPSTCSQTGTQTATSVCIVNPTTGRGCIDSSGAQTFATRSTQRSCVPLCRSSGWIDEITTGCMLPTGSDGKELPCYQRNTAGTRTIRRTCQAIDATGPNTCTYTVPLGNTGVIPPQCRLDAIGTTVTCQVGYVLTQQQSCVPNVEGKVCGVWRVSAEEPCLGSTSISQAGVCLDANANPYTQDTQIMSIGWTAIPMKCVQDDDFTKPGVYCPQPSDCVMPGSAYGRMATAGGNPVTICGPTPGCGRLCTFYPPVVSGNWVPSIKQLILNFQILTTTDGFSQYALGLNNVPCPSENGRFLAPDVVQTTVPLSDCLGDPNRPLRPTFPLWLNLTSMSQQLTRYNLDPSCTFDKIEVGSSLYVTFRPTRPAQIGTQLNCNIFCILGKNYVGWLRRLGGSEAIWDQTTFGTIPTGSEYEFIVLGQSGQYGPFTYQIYNTDMSSVVITTSDRKTINMERIQIAKQVSNLETLQAILNARQTRWDPTNCNVMYTYPPPPGYMKPDNSVNPLLLDI